MNRNVRNLYSSYHSVGLPDRLAAHALLARISAADCPAAPQPPRMPLTLYGGGDMGRLARDYFAMLGWPIDLVIDRNADALRQDSFWHGTAVAHPSEVPAEVRRTALLVLCVATAPYKPLEVELHAEGWADIVPFYDVAESQRHRHPLSNGWFAPRLDAEALRRTQAVLDGWDDDVSRAHHLQFLAWRRIREEWTFDGAPVTRDDRFFIPEVMALRGLRRFVDAGAHHGSVTRKFARVRKNFAEIVMIEPDPANIKTLAAMQDALPAEVANRIAVRSVALGAEQEERPFHHGLGYASQFASTGQDLLRSVPLDSLDLKPDFLKLHLEGSELDALRGARETIRRHRPVLAVTTYHNADGIWRTPAWMMEEVDDYRCLMRLHSWCGTGAVVYAIPRERELGW